MPPTYLDSCNRSHQPAPLLDKFSNHSFVIVEHVVVEHEVSAMTRGRSLSKNTFQCTKVKTKRQLGSCWRNMERQETASRNASLAIVVTKSWERSWLQLSFMNVTNAMPKKKLDASKRGYRQEQCREISGPWKSLKAVNETRKLRDSLRICTTCSCCQCHQQVPKNKSTSAELYEGKRKAEEEVGCWQTWIQTRAVSYNHWFDKFDLYIIAMKIKLNKSTVNVD